jgi:hypothetical protein
MTFLRNTDHYSFDMSFRHDAMNILAERSTLLEMEMINLGKDFRIASASSTWFRLVCLAVLCFHSMAD